MIELRWLLEVDVIGAKKRLQYRTFTDVSQEWSDMLQQYNNVTVWSDWRDVPTVRGE